MSRRGILFATALLAAGAVQAEVSYVGEARDPDSGVLLYEEHHLLRQGDGRPDERLVTYRCRDGRAFARKRVEYHDAPAAPGFTLEDARFGYREGARRDGASVTAFVRADADAKQREATLAAGPALVIDAGFDEFVRAHWAQLTRGETLRLDFLVPSRLETMRFKLRRVGQPRIDGAPASVFRLSLGGLLGLVAPDIEVGYRDADRRLMSFEGMTNIRADREDNVEARIVFPPARERPAADAAAWAAALAEPLRACALHD